MLHTRLAASLAERNENLPLVIMADPVTVLGIVNGSAGLILKCAYVVKSLYEVAEKYEKAGIAVMALESEVDTNELAWTRIKKWAEDYSTDATVDTGLLKRMNRSLECGALVMSVLQNDLSDYQRNGSSLSFRQRSKAIWNERALQDHQNRVRGQAVAMALLLQVLKLPTLEGQSNLLQESNHVFQNSDESAYSIVPSRRSSSTQSSNARDSVELTDMVYQRLSFEEDLFAGRVYKRRYGDPLIHSVFRRNLEPFSRNHEAEHSNTLVAIGTNILNTQEEKSAYAKGDLPMDTKKFGRVKHRHVEQVVKSYRGNQRFGYTLTTLFRLTVQPAATTDLETILNRYHESDRRGRHRGHVSDVLRYHFILTAFGCLSRGLAYMHRLDLLHGDIRPANILYQNSSSTMSTARLMWALSSEYGIKRSSRYLGDHATPEMDISNNSQVPFEERARHPEASQFLSVSDGKSMDIFSFGYVILQLLTILGFSDSERTFRSFAPFRGNIDRIHAWIEEQISNLYPIECKNFLVIFQLGMRMTQADPKKRPLIEEVLYELTKAGRQYFCPECLLQPKDSMTESAQS